MEHKAVIFGKNIEISEKTEEYIQKKIGKTEKFLSDIDDIRIDVAYVKSARSAVDRYVSQITIRGKGYILRTEERADDLYTAFDTSLDKMSRQIERFKGKRSHVRNEKITVLVGDASLDLMDAESEEPVIVRRKKFQMVPMDELEAIEQMQLLGHEDFFIFYNSNTGSVNVLYKRHDGKYGLIEAEIG